MGTSAMSAATMAANATAAETSASGVAMRREEPGHVQRDAAKNGKPISRKPVPLARTEPQSSATMGSRLPAAPRPGYSGPWASAAEIPLRLIRQIAVPVDEQGHQLEIEDREATRDQEGAEVRFRPSHRGSPGANSAAVASAAKMA